MTPPPLPRRRLPDRLLLALALASAGGWAAGLLHAGAVLGRAASPRVVLAVGALGGLLAALVRGRRAWARGLYVLPFALYSATLTLTTSAYVHARGRIWNGELVIPSAVALPPFGLVYRLTARHIDRSERRSR